MPQSLSKVLLHIVFSTKQRMPLILPEIEQSLHAYMAFVCKACESPAIIVGGVEDHAHLFCDLSRKIPLCGLIEEVKKRSSKWAKEQDRKHQNFAWQNGYWATSVGLKDIDRVKRYIANQREHHRKKTFKEEYKEILEQHHVEFDERYAWD